MSSGISVTVKEHRSIKGLSRTTLLPQFYIKRVAIPTHSVVQTKMMWKSCRLLPRRKADVNSRSNTFVQLYDNMEEPGMFPLLSRLLQPSRVFLLAMDVPGQKKKSELPAWDPSIFWQKVCRKVTVLAAPRESKT